MDQLFQDVSCILANAHAVSLDRMDTVALQNRIDRKYILHSSRLPELLSQVINNYYILEINQHRIFSYRTTYFDTVNYQFFKDHHNGLTSRIKVRCRQYIETDNTFFEIKRKYQGNRTDKIRTSIAGMPDFLGEEAYKQVVTWYKKHPIDKLEIALHNFFHRITLVNKNFTERVTIDFNVRFSNEYGVAELGNVVIIEVKQGKYDERSSIVQLLKKAKVYPASISKYTYGLLLLQGNQIKYNAFKPLINKVYKIQHNNGGYRNYA